MNVQFQKNNRIPDLLWSMFYYIALATAFMASVIPIGLFVLYLSYVIRQQGELTYIDTGIKILDQGFFPGTSLAILLALLIIPLTYLTIAFSRRRNFDKLYYGILIAISPYFIGILIPMSIAAMVFYSLAITAVAVNPEHCHIFETFSTCNSFLFINSVPHLFSVYLAIFSVTAVIRGFYTFNVIQTALPSFYNLVTAELKKTANNQKGEVIISLPWTAFGLLSMPEHFVNFKKELDRCIKNNNIKVCVQCLEIVKIHELLEKTNLLSSDQKTYFYKHEKLFRDNIIFEQNHESHLRTCYDITDIKSCIIFDSKMFIISNIVDQAARDGKIGATFLATTITDALIINNFRKEVKNSFKN